MSYRFRERPSKLFGLIKRPYIDIKVQNSQTQRWYAVHDVLVDTGADISIIPFQVGAGLVVDIKMGRDAQLTGVVPGTRLIGHIHDLRIRFDGNEFESPVLISTRNDVQPILGRTGAIDRFLAEFDRGEELRISGV